MIPNEADRRFRQLDNDEIRDWYFRELAEAFAENERKPLGDIFSLIAQDRYEIWGLFGRETGMPCGAEGGKGCTLIGYAALWKRPGIPLVLLDYLGVTAPLRGGGTGSEILKLLKDLNVPIVAESEMPVEGDTEEANSIRRRRIAFYERNGFAPAYEMATCGMRWKALTANTGGLAMSEVMRMHRELYGPERTDVKVPLGPDETPEMPYWMK